MKWMVEVKITYKVTVEVEAKNEDDASDVDDMWLAWLRSEGVISDDCDNLDVEECDRIVARAVGVEAE